MANEAFFRLIVMKSVLTYKPKFWSFQLVAPNARVVAVSEKYNSRDACLKGIEAVRRYAGTTRIIEE